MAVSPLTNPINASPVAGPDAVEERIADQRAGLDPALIGENLASQAAAAATQAATEAAALVANSQSNQQIASLQQQIADMRNDFAATQQPAAEPEPAFDGTLTQEELAEMGTHLPGAIDKRAQAAAMAMRDDAVRRATEASDARIKSLEDQIAALTGQQTKQAETQANNFDASAIALATSAGVDVNTLAQDPNWKAMLQEVADPVAGTTYGQYYDHAYGAKNLQLMGKIFAQFGQRLSSNQAAAHTPAPMPAGGAARVTPAAGGEGDIGTQVAQLKQERDELASARQFRRISAVDYQKGVAALDKRAADLQAAMTPKT